MKNLGCTTLFGKNYENTCTNETKAKEAMEIFKQETKNSSCLFPCKFLASFTATVDSSESEDGRKLRIFFKEYVQTITVKCTYDELDLEAAVGGFVGLFLGISIFQIKDGLIFIIRKLHQ